MIGVDFDNTIINYDALMRVVAIGRGLVASAAPADKRAIRDLIRARPDGDIEWQRVQGEVYGPRIGEAVPMDGVGAFLRRCAGAGVTVHIVSHKTERAGYDPTNTNLRQAALQWLEDRSAFSPGGFALRPEAIRFAATRQEKIGHIRSLRCRVFIDDLREVFAEADFPDDVVRILYDPSGGTATAVDRVCRHWSQIEAYLFDDAG